MTTKPKTPDLIAQVLRLNDLDPTLVARVWRENLNLGGQEGVIAVVVLGRVHAYAVMNVPVLVFGSRAEMQIGGALELVGCLPEIEGALYAASARRLTLLFCRRMPWMGEEDIPAKVAELHAGARAVRMQLLQALKHFYPGAYEDEEANRTPTLPNIKMTPGEMKIIYGVLARCDLGTQRLFANLMERWSRAGYGFSTIPSRIRLEVPYGDGTMNLADLYPGLPYDMARLAPDGKPYPPGIEIAWGILKQRKGFPAMAVEKYRKAILAVARLRETPNWALVENLGSFDGPKAGKFLKALKDLAASVRHENVELPKASGPVTPGNTAATLVACDPKSRAIFKQLLRGWRDAGGTVLCNKTGRIYLKLKTRAHKAGHDARLARNFSLLVLAAARRTGSAHIDVAWGLARAGTQTAYLDCIPDVVEEFEKTVAGLPGFEHKGVVTRVMLDRGFGEQHAARLVGIIQKIKKAEAAAP